MKVITTIDITYTKGKLAEMAEAMKNLAIACNKHYPDYEFSVISPRSSSGGRMIWVEQCPSLAAKEKWEETRMQVPEIAKLAEPYFALMESYVVNEYGVHDLAK